MLAGLGVGPLVELGLSLTKMMTVIGTAMRSIRECPSASTKRGDLRKRGQTTHDEPPSRHYGSEGWEFESLRARTVCTGQSGIRRRERIMRLRWKRDQVARVGLSMDQSAAPRSLSSLSESASPPIPFSSCLAVVPVATRPNRLSV